MSYKTFLAIACLVSPMIMAGPACAESVVVSPESDSKSVAKTDKGDEWSGLLEENPDARVKSFNDDLAFRGIEGKIICCKQLISIRLGRENKAYAAFCELETPKKTSMITICNDEMVGDFSIESSFEHVGKNGSEYSAKSLRFSSNKIDGYLVEFVKLNCPGHG